MKPTKLSRLPISLVFTLLTSLWLNPVPAQAGYVPLLTGTLTTGPNYNVDLSTLGTTDWTLWGYGSGGRSTSLIPDVSMAGGSGISALTYIDPKLQPRRGLGQFSINYEFSWTDGNSVASSLGAFGGLQTDTGVGPGDGVGEGFSFTVPASTTEQEVKIFVDQHLGTAQLTAILSDGSATPYIDSSIPNGVNSPGVYTIDFAAASAGQTLNISWVETADSQPYDNPAIYAVTLGLPAPAFAAPEPSAFVLLGLGGLVLGGQAWRKKKRTA